MTVNHGAAAVLVGGKKDFQVPLLAVAFYVSFS